MITVHLILNAHIDPVWLWPWQAGADEMIATCRSACDRLDAHPDIVFTRGEAWGYRVIERIDPALFARIRDHIAAGRWEIAGGWWLQPDCNLPGAEGFEKQVALGRAYFESRFGRFPRVAYNVDSFGHAASLPGLMRRHGQDRYVMMRPQEHEKTLPARLFRWRGFAGDEPVTTFRIAGHYATHAITREHVLAACEGLPPGVTHTMCFIGIGDHGGGPTERQIAWCRENAEAIPGCRLVFSSLQRFFDAVEAEGAALPDHTGELQHHAVGCYSVMRAIKVAVRRAEQALDAAAIVACADPAPEANTQARLDAAWEAVCFNHFHDTLGGTCIPSAYPALLDQLGGASAAADDIAQMGFRRMVARLPDDRRQRIALFNASAQPFDGHAILAPWTGARWKPHWRIRDAQGALVPYQLMQQEAIADQRPRVLLRVRVAPAAMTTLTIDREAKAETDGASHSAAEPDTDAARAEVGGALRAGDVELRGDGAPEIDLGRGLVIAPRIELYDDLTDTWAHGVARLGTGAAQRAVWQARTIADEGPLMASAIQTGAMGDARLHAEWRVWRGERMVELLLRVDWRARHKVLKLAVALPAAIATRDDGIPGTVLRRRECAREQPLRDFTRVVLDDASDGARARHREPRPLRHRSRGAERVVHAAKKPADGASRSRAGGGCIARGGRRTRGRMNFGFSLWVVRGSRSWNGGRR